MSDRHQYRVLYDDKEVALCTLAHFQHERSQYEAISQLRPGTQHAYQSLDTRVTVHCELKPLTMERWARQTLYALYCEYSGNQWICTGPRL